MHCIVTCRSRTAQLRRLFSLATAAATLFAFSGHCRAGLIITPTFDSSITSDPNAAAIESVINSAISIYESDFSDPINVTIDFKEMSSGLGDSQWTYYTIPYQTFINDLTADATTANDAIALAHLPHGSTDPADGSTFISVKTANLRAIGITGDNSILPGGYDGIISLNTNVTNVGSPGTTGQYSLMATAEHEIDEVLGLGSGLQGSGNLTHPLPEDLFRYTQGPSGSLTYTKSGDNAYFSIDGGVTDLARFNQDSSGDYGDWWSNNGAGNPGPNPPTQVQDAFAFPGTSPTLGVNELTALDVIGYNLVVPEPSTIALVFCGFAAIGIWQSKRLLSKRAAAAI